MQRYSVNALEVFARTLFVAMGVDADKAPGVAPAQAQEQGISYDANAWSATSR